jgi:hypothetical protein
MRHVLASLVGACFGVGLGVLGIWALGRHQAAEPKIQQHRALLPEADGALRHVLLHWTPKADRDLARPYADFLSAIAPNVKVTFVVPRNMAERETKMFEQRLVAIDPKKTLLARVVRVEVDGPITAWAKDRALVSKQESESSRARLIIPAEPTDNWIERHNDWRTVAEVVRKFPEHFELDAAPFDFDAGDIAVGRGSLIIDTNLLEKNRRRGYRNLQQLAGRLGEYLQMQVITLGQDWGDTPRHHLSMYMTPLTKNQVLVGDPKAAAAIVGEPWKPGEVAGDTQLPLAADFSPETVARFERAKQQLLAQGFEVTSIVNVPFDDKTYLAYTNGVFEVRDGRRIAYVPAYDVPALDEAAHETYKKLGWEVVPIHVRSLYPFHGTIGCVVNVLERQ